MVLNFDLRIIFLMFLEAICDTSGQGPPKAQACKNEYEDMGLCMPSLQCDLLKGINIGLCPGIPGVTSVSTCCHHLPCSLPEPDNQDLQLLINLKVRTVRDLRSKIGMTNEITSNEIPFIPAKSELSRNCGLRNVAATGQSFSPRQPHGRSEQLINGQETRSSLSYPWMLALWIRFNQTQVPTCGAGLISDRYAITAAHCVADTRLDFVLRGGSIINKIIFSRRNDGAMHPGDQLGGGVVIEIDKIVIHPKYQPFTFENDIAIIRFQQRVQLSRELFPICLPPPVPLGGKVTDYAGEMVTVTGWGCEAENCDAKSVPIVLREANIQIVSNDVGMCWFMNDSIGSGGSEYIPSRVFLVGGDESGSKATCNGDSGSPVVRKVPTPTLNSNDDGSARWEVIGLVSWSKGCGRPLRPSVWTRVESYVEWIKSLMVD